jgi:hypothetical protein
MPNFDGTGPLGKGPGTGRGLGPCGKFKGAGTGRGRGRQERISLLEEQQKALEKELDSLRDTD